MKTFKQFTSLLGAVIALVALVFGAASATAADIPRTYVADYTATTLTDMPSTLTVDTTATNYFWVDVRRSPTVAFQLSAQLMATNPGAATLAIPIHRSIDGVTAETTAVNGLLLTFTGVLPIVHVTNLNVGQFGYLRIGPSMVNTATNGAAVTNISLKMVGKPPWSLTYPYGGP